MSLIVVILLVSLSGLFSGLNLGLLSLSKSGLERKIKLGNKDAKKVYSVRKNSNLLLCTLLLGNVAVNASIAIFLGDITSGVLAGVISTALIVTFGEIIPQAVASKYALKIGAKTAWIIKIFIFILYPICFPISKVLDMTIGEEIPTVWSKHELEEIIKVHKGSDDSELDADEERIILGAMSYSNKIVDEIMTPRAAVFMLNEKEILNTRMINKIKKSGLTRIPVYHESIDNIIGILFVKDLIGLKSKKKVKDVCQKGSFLEANLHKKLDVLLNLFIQKKKHLAIVHNKYNEFVGIVTLEDVIEEIFKVEIVDEFDKVVDTRKLLKNKKY